MRRLIAALGIATAALLFAAVPALACGGLVAPDGDVRLDKATTFVAWHDGIEHYVTSFSYSGNTPDVGWIVPLPAVPTFIGPAGRWTLQRLELEFNPPAPERLAFAAASADKQSIVVEQVQVEALDVTILKGSGSQVVSWCAHNGFLLPVETKDHLLQYARGTPVFMAAKYNTSLAQRRGLQSGDGVPLLMTMRTPHLWVPLEVLANDNAPVNADLFLLTDQQPHPLGALSPFDWLFQRDRVDGAVGFTLVRSEQMSSQLHHDLSGDRNMSWVPSTGWLTYLRLNAPSDAVTYDLGVGTDSVIRLASFGTPAGLVGRDLPPAAPSGGLVPALLVLVAALGAVSVLVVRRQRLAMSTGSAGSAGSSPSTREMK